MANYIIWMDLEIACTTGDYLDRSPTERRKIDKSLAAALQSQAPNSPSELTKRKVYTAGSRTDAAEQARDAAQTILSSYDSLSYTFEDPEDNDWVDIGGGGHEGSLKGSTANPYNATAPWERSVTEFSTDFDGLVHLYQNIEDG